MKNLDEQIKRIKELMSEETLYGRKIDLITETNIGNSLKTLFRQTNTGFVNIRNQLKKNQFIKGYDPYEWTKNVTNKMNKIKLNPLPDITTNPKISDVNKILRENKKTLDEINEYFKKLEIDAKVATPENTSTWTELSESLPFFSEQLEETKKYLMLPSNKLTKANIKFISIMTDYDVDGVKKLLTTLSDTIKHFNTLKITSGKVFSSLKNWYSVDSKNGLVKVLKGITPFNPVVAWKGGTGWKVVKTLSLWYVQAMMYGWLFKKVRCEFFNDPEIQNLKQSWGQKEQSDFEKYNTTNLPSIISKLNENPLIQEIGTELITGGWSSVFTSDCEPIDDKIIDELVNKGLLLKSQIPMFKNLGRNYLKELGIDVDDMKSQFNDRIDDLKEGIINDGGSEFKQIIADPSSPTYYMLGNSNKK